MIWTVADLIHKDANIGIGGHASNAVVLLLQSIQLAPAIQLSGYTNTVVWQACDWWNYEKMR